MPVLDKNQAVIDWLLKCPTIAANPLFFNFLKAEDEGRQMVVQASDAG